MLQAHLLEKLEWAAEVTVVFGAIEQGTVKAEDSECRGLETVAEDTEVRQPLHVRREIIEVDEEPRDEEHRHRKRCDQKYGQLKHSIQLNFQVCTVLIQTLC